MKRYIFLKVLLIACITLLSDCKNNHESEQGNGYFMVTVKQYNNPNLGLKAYIFLKDSLYGITDARGIYENDSIPSGRYLLTCSAINFRDTTLNIVINEGKSTKLNLSLLSDSSIGTVYGEFQDLIIFNQKSIDKPELKTWNEEQVYDAVTGATIYKINRPDIIPPRTVSLGDSIIAVSDGFGQYWFQIQSGTYQVIGACDGYLSSSRVIKVLPGSNNYVNFFLKKN